MNTESRNIINQEIQEMAPALVAMPRTNPFRVPGGYFSDQSEALEFGVSSSEELSLHTSLIAARSVNPFSVPVDYFKGLLADVMLSIRAENAEPVLGETLTALKGSNPFKVPSAYFQDLGATIMGRLAGAEEIGLSREAAKDSFKVPENYFETLPGRILDRVKKEEAQPQEKPAIKEVGKETGKQAGEQAPKVRELAPDKAKGGGIRRALIFATAAAAVLLLMFIGPSLPEMFNSGAGPTASNDPYDLEGAFASLSDDEFDYILEGADFNADELGEYIDMDEFSEFDNLDDDLLREMLLLEFDEKTLKDNLLWKRLLT